MRCARSVQVQISHRKQCPRSRRLHGSPLGDMSYIVKYQEISAPKTSNIIKWEQKISPYVVQCFHSEALPQLSVRTYRSYRKTRNLWETHARTANVKLQERGWIVVIPSSEDIPGTKQRGFQHTRYTDIRRRFSCLSIRRGTVTNPSRTAAFPRSSCYGCACEPFANRGRQHASSLWGGLTVNSWQQLTAFSTE